MLLNLLSQFREYIKLHRLSEPSDHWLIAVSGGVDSVVLCHLCQAAGYRFSIAHANFNLRGQESDADEAFVHQLAASLDVTVYARNFATSAYAAQNKLSIQVAARNLRYSWFRELLEGSKNSLKFVATAHHVDDNAETVLLNFFKGTGISGLTGMSPRKDRIIRPLLFAEKADLLQYAASMNLQWVADSSNESTDYTRNFLRLKVVPLLSERFPAVIQNITGSIARWTDTEILYKQAIARHRKELVSLRGAEAYVPVLKLQKSIPLATITYELIKEYGFTSRQTGEVLKLLHGTSGSYIYSQTHRILRNRAWLIISPRNIVAQTVLLIEEGELVATFDDRQLSIRKLNAADHSISTDPSVAVIDAKNLGYPLLLRRWQAGDYFYPLGMNKKKKLARFFIDKKLSLTEKENAWVLESNKRIVWVLGHRIDDRFKVTTSTKEVVRFAINHQSTP